MGVLRANCTCTATAVGSTHRGPFGQHTMKSCFRSASSYSTAYSGAGFFESIVWQLSAHLGIGPPRCTHGWGVLEKARSALMAAEVGDGPEHIFGDLMGIFRNVP